MARRPVRLEYLGILPSIIAFVPLVIAPGVLFYFDVTPKIVILLLGVAAALPWFAPRRQLRWLYIILSVQAGSLVLSTLVSSRMRLSILGSTSRRFGLITQLALLLFTALAASDLARGRQRLRAYLRAAAAAAIPVALYGIAQYFGWDPWIPKQAYHVGQGVWTIVRPPGTLGYVSDFANYLVFAVFLGIALYGIEERGWWKRAGAAAAALAAFAIVLSGTRAAMLAVLLGVAYLWLGFGIRVRKRVMAMAAGLVAAIALFFFSPAGQMLRSRTRWYVEDPRGGARLMLWRDSLTLASRHWLVGVGPETFVSEFPRVQSAALSRAFPGFYHESPHNILLDALTAQGVIGLIALVGFVWLGFCGESAPALRACLIAGVVTHQFTVFTTPTALYFYLTVALLASLNGGADPPVRGRPPGRPLRLAYATLSLALAVFAIRLLLADRMLFLVREASKPIEAAQSYRRARLWGLDADLWYSRRMAALGAWQPAMEAGLRATRTSDEPSNAWYSLAVLHARENDFEATERCLREAVESSPNWFKPHWMLAQVLETKGRREEARAQAALAASLDGGKNPEVAQTLAGILAKEE
jgi:O-antigen ligase